MYLFPNFIDDERCDHVVKIASDKLGPSGLAYRKTDDPNNSRDVRTSSGTFMSRHNDPAGVLAWVEEKIHAISGFPVSHGEPFNVLRYQLGQHYDAHYDTFDPEEYGPQSSQRVATVLFYLTDVEEGGETIFPLEGPDGMKVLQHIDYRACKDGYKYRPRKGDALMFMSVHPNGTFDKHALHGGCPVKKGVKMVMTKWIRDQCHGACSTPLI
jgi:prolyl 4-hydroxylase